MPRRYEAHAEPSTAPLRPATALRAALRHGYGRQDLRADLLAGVVVGIVALPLSMALAVASGVAPQHGLYTAIVAGAVIAALGGSMVQVSGPTAAFVVLLAPIAARFGLGGLVMATWMAGGILILMGVLRLGSLIQFVPYPVTTGFTAGIAVVIGTLQLKDFLGLEVPHMPEHYLERLGALLRALPTVRPAEDDRMRGGQLVYVLSAVLASVSGMLLSAYSGGAALDMAGDFLLMSIAVVVLGGTSIAGGQATVAGPKGQFLVTS